MHFMDCGFMDSDWKGPGSGFPTSREDRPAIPYHSTPQLTPAQELSEVGREPTVGVRTEVYLGTAALGCPPRAARQCGSDTPVRLPLTLRATMATLAILPIEQIPHRP